MELGAAASAGILLLLFRRQTAPAASGRRTQVKDYLPSGLLLATVALLIAASLLPERPPMTNGLICMGLMLAGAVCMGLRRRSFAAFLAPFRETDFRTLALLFGLFILVGGITEAGVVDAAARLFTRLGGGNMFLIYTAVVWGSVIISAFIDNIPYVATMLPVVQSVAVTLGAEPELLYFGLLSGATLGGNLTPVGASANITGIGILRRDGREVSNRDFMRIGVPFTLAAVIPAYVFIWIFYGG